MSKVEKEDSLQRLERENSELKELVKTLQRSQQAHKVEDNIHISPQQQYLDWNIIDSVPDLIFFKDKALNYLGANQNYLKFVGKSLAELSGLSDYEIHSKEEADLLRAIDEKIIKERISDTRREWISGSNGKEMYLETQKSPLIDLQGNVYGVIGVAKDVTKNINLQNILQLTNEKLNEAQKIAKIGHWVWDIKEENLWWSDEIYRIFGFVPQQFGATYEAFLNTIHPLDRDTVHNATMTALEQKNKYNVFHRIILPDGREKIVHEVGEGSYDDKGAAVQMIGTVQDVTEIKRIEAALELSITSYKELNEKLDQKVKEQTLQLLKQSRLAQMGELISMIAHQWRQPLASISAAVHSINVKRSLDVFDLDSKAGQKEFDAFLTQRLHNIEKFTYQLSTTIEDFRSFYKPNKEKKRALIAEPVARSLEIVKNIFNDSHITLVNQLDSQKEIDLYENELMQVVLNILKNAEDNFAENGIQSPSIAITSRDTQNGVVLEICDNGGGIAPEIQDKIFDPYFSTKEDKNGTGLGLYMSKIIIEEHHHGKIGVENRGDGVCFTIELFDPQPLAL